MLLLLLRMLPGDWKMARQCFFWGTVDPEEIGECCDLGVDDRLVAKH